MYAIIVGIILTFQPMIIAESQPAARHFETLEACERAKSEVQHAFGGPGRDGRWSLLDVYCKRIDPATVEAVVRQEKKRRQIEFGAE